MSTRSKFLAVALGFVGAVVGAIVILVGLHAYTDHQAFHVLMNIAVENARKAQRAPQD